MATCTELRRRRRQRGAVTLEALIVTLVMIGLFFGVVGLGGLYRAKLKAQQEARFRSTWNATNGCTIAGPSLAGFAFGEIEGEPSTPQDPVQGLRDVGRLAVSGGTSRGRDHQTFSFGPGSGSGFKGISGTVSASSVTACNPIAIELGPLELAGELKDELSRIVQSVLN
jgi:hypothetical protein